MITILVGLVALLALYAAMAPLESLRWWSRSGAAEVRSTVAALLREPDADAAPGERRVYVVYLSGIGVVDGTANSKRELAVVSAVQAALPEVAVAADVFPYSVTNRGLITGDRVNTRLWTWLRALRRRRPSNPWQYAINARNAFQMFVSADPRYGPTYNVGVAKEIARSLARAGFSRASGSPVVIVGYSGGGQVAVGASWYLDMAGIDVSVVSIGGMLADDPGLDRIRHLWHLYGTKDSLQAMGKYLFLGRWPVNALSAWNRALRGGRITFVELGPMIHNGRRDYFDAKALLPDGTSHADRTAAAIVAAVREVDALRVRGPTG